MSRPGATTPSGRDEHHEVEPPDPSVKDMHPIPSRTGAAADALLDEQSRKVRSETESALDRATGNDRTGSD